MLVDERMTVLSNSAQHLLKAADQVRKFGTQGEAAAAELEKLAHSVATGQWKGGC